MNDKEDEERGLLIRIFSSKDIQKGMAFFSIALILAFAAVIPVTDVDVVSEKDISGPHHLKEIPYSGYNVINATLEMSTTGRANLSIQDSLGEDAQVLLKESVSKGENETIYLTEKEFSKNPRWLNFTSVEGNLTYTYTFKYSHNPYGLLSLPAGFFTLVGMVFAFRGKGVILGEIKRKQMEEERRKKLEEREEKADEEISIEEEEIEGEVIYEGEDSDKEKSETDHINFMGIPDEEDEEESEGE